MLGERIQQARRARGLSLRALADRVGLSATMLSKYERGLATPSSDVLIALSDALDVRSEYFFRTAKVHLEQVAHRNRHRWKLPHTEESRVLADVQEQLERWSTLDTILPAPWSVKFALPKGLPTKVADYEEIEKIAVTVRRQWNLGLNPIPDLIDTFETKGIKVFTTQFDDPRFEGLSARADGQPVVVIGRHWPGDRQRFTLAHELGHLTLDERLAKELDKEIVANRFAGAFLVPAEKVKECLGEQRHKLEVYELYLLKQEYGLSIAGWSYRALDLRIVSKTEHRRFWRYLCAKGWNTEEPGDPYPPETMRLFQQSVYRALGEDLISESRAAELLGIALPSLVAQRGMENSVGDHRQ